MPALSVLVRRWGVQGQSMVAARHPKRVWAAASGPATVAAVTCLVGLLLALAVVVVAKSGWEVQRPSATTAQRVLLPILLVQLAVSGALYLVHQSVPRPVHTFMTVLWLLPLGLTALVVGGAGASSHGSVIAAWGLFGLALTLWILAGSLVGTLARTLCYSAPLLLLALWSAAGFSQTATETAAITVVIMAAAAIVAVPGVLVARAVSDIPRVHRWAGDAQQRIAGQPSAVLWLVVAKVVLLLAYLAFARWRFPQQDFVPGSPPQWGMAVVCALFVLLPMRMARSRTMDDVRVGRIARALGVVVATALVLPVCIAIGSVLWARGDVLGPLALVLLLGGAVAASRLPAWRRTPRAAAVLLVPLAALAGFLVPVLDPGGRVAEPFQIAWLVAGLVVGGALALVFAGWLAWRYGELWYVTRAVGFIGLWIVLVTVLKRTGIGLAGVDIALTVMLLAAAAWITRRPRTRLAAIEVLALCALPLIAIYGPDLLAGAPAATRPWLVAAALVAPGGAALWHHLGLDSGAMHAGHTAALAGLAAVYGLVASCILILGTASTEALSDLAEALLSYLVIPLAVLFIAMLEGRDPGDGRGDAGPRP